MSLLQKSQNNQFFSTYEQTKNWLDEMQIRNYTINPQTLEVDVHDSVKLPPIQINLLPVKFNFVDGDFYCDTLALTSLNGSPTKIAGSFNCDRNLLTSLKGAPKQVPGVFCCCHNQLTSLNGAPEYVGNDFICPHNQLTSLKGAPATVGVDFLCHGNQLTTLEGAPNEINGDFWCQENQLTSLYGGPTIIHQDYYCFSNKLISLQYCPPIIETHIAFDANENTLRQIYKYVKSAKSLVLKNPEDHMKGLLNIFIIKNLKHIFLYKTSLEYNNINKIINKHLESGQSGPVCQLALIEAGLGSYTKI